MIFTIISTLLLALFGYQSFSAPWQAPSYVDFFEGYATSALEDQGQPCPLPTTRYSIHTGQVACYPSSGGIWMSELDALELQYLGIDRFLSTERPDVPKEK